MSIKKLIGSRVLLENDNVDYVFFSNDGGLLVPAGYDLNGSYREGIVKQVSEKSMCKQGDRIVYQDSAITEYKGSIIVDDSAIVLIKRCVI